MKSYNTIIIGAGAAGCMCALSSTNKSVAIIDQGKMLAKKIMVTGNGRCNLTNTNMNSKYFNNNIEYFLNRFAVNDTIKFFEQLGLMVYSDNEGRIYPYSNSAKSVVDVINYGLSCKVDSYLDNMVLDVFKTNDRFVVKTDKIELECENLVVATGGNTAIKLCDKFKIGYRKPIPSLVALKSNAIQDLNGIRLSGVKVKAITRNGFTKEDIGEVLFKEKGISGIVIFNVSVIFARNQDFSGEIIIDLIPKLSIEELEKKLENRRILNIKLDRFFQGMFQNAVANEIFRQSKINTNINSAKLALKDIKILARTIKNLKFSVDGCYDNNQVYSGGVLLQELDENLMSRKVPNLYFIGEVCDVDGECGGYNLQWAWTSGEIVGDALC